MIYVHRRKNDLVDMLIAQDNGVRIEISDGTSGEADDKYVVILDGVGFTQTDPDPNTDQSSTIASNLASAIDASTLRVGATVSGSTVEVIPDVSGVELAVETSTTDEQGSIFHRTFTPESYVVKNASNWDQAFSTMETVSRNTGKRSESLQTRAAKLRHKVNANQFRDRVRFLFNPLDYGLVDENVLFFRVAPMLEGVEQAERPIEIVLTEQQMVDAHSPVILTGTLAQAAEGGGTDFHLPRQCSSVVIRNHGADDILVQFESGAGEIRLAQDESFRENRLATSLISMRTDDAGAAPSEVEIYFTLNHNRNL